MNTLDSKISKLKRRFHGKAPYFGFYSEVARDCQTWPSHVRRVFLGHATSARVLKGILTTIDRWDRSREKERRAA